MINLNTLTDNDIGRWVTYKRDFGDPERGRLKSWNHKYIFVVFNCADEWDNFMDYTGASVDPEYLNFDG